MSSQINPSSLPHFILFAKTSVKIAPLSLLHVCLICPLHCPPTLFLNIHALYQTFLDNKFLQSDTCSHIFQARQAVSNSIINHIEMYVANRLHLPSPSLPFSHPIIYFHLVQSHPLMCLISPLVLPACASTPFQLSPPIGSMSGTMPMSLQRQSASRKILCPRV